MLSLTRAIQYKQHKRTLKIATGWLLNHAFFTMLLLVFMTYGCRFEEESDLSEKESQAAHPP